MKKLFENLWNWFTTPNTDDCCDVEVCEEVTPVEVEEEQESVREILERVLLEAGISESTIRNLDVLSAFEQWYEGALTKEDIKDSIQSFKEAVGGAINAKLNKLK